MFLYILNFVNSVITLDLSYSFLVLWHLYFEGVKQQAQDKIYKRCFSQENDAMAKQHQKWTVVKGDYTVEREDNMKLDIDNAQK